MAKYLSVDKNKPEAHGCCDRCGFVYNHSKLSWQYQYAGKGLINLGLLVCPACLDVPNMQLLVVTLPPDPVPIKNPRPFDRNNAMNDYRVVENYDRLLTQNGDDRIVSGSEAYLGEIPDL